jgi:hypothetical protein
MIDENGCIIFGPRTKACPSWPVRVAGMQGLWRFVKQMPWPNLDYVEVIGPYFPNNSTRNGGRSRLINIDNIRYAGKNAKPIDVINVEAQALSNEAKRARRR